MSTILLLFFVISKIRSLFSVSFPPLVFAWTDLKIEDTGHFYPNNYSDIPHRRTQALRVVCVVESSAI